MTTEADRLERAILNEGKRWLRRGYAPLVLVDIQDGAKALAALRAEPRCDWCDGLISECDGPPVRNDEEVSWRGAQARVWCCTNCQTERYAAEQNADGNRP